MTNENIIKLASKADNAKMVTVRDVVEHFLAEIDSGRTNPKQAIIVYVEDLDNGDEKLHARWANMDRVESVYYLNCALYEELHGDWRRD